MADSRLDVLSTLLRGATIDGGAQSQCTLKAIAAHRAREPHHVLMHGWALLQRPERLGDDGAATARVETVLFLRTGLVDSRGRFRYRVFARVAAKVKYWTTRYTYE